MRASTRLAAWNDPGSSSFEIVIDSEDVTMQTSSVGHFLRLKYAWTPRGGYADSQGLSACLITLEGWLGHQRDGHSLGLRIPSQVVPPNAPSLDAPITDAQVAALDAARGADDLSIHIFLSGTARVPLPGERDRGATNEHGVLVRPEYRGEINSVRIDSGTPLSITISQQRWIDMMNVTGTRKFRLVEFAQPVSSKLERVISLLEAGVLNLRRGEWRDAVAKAREVVEGILVEVAQHWNVPRERIKARWCEQLGKRLSRAWPGDPSSGVLFGNLLAAGWAWTSEEHHYSATIVSKRAEAEFALGLASDLIILAGELMDAHPDKIEQLPPAPEIVEP